ncbi:GGDEF domain-containing response regulator [Vibrio ziniensis]|uniref:diguanylate cyclase n=1 Tax=Vibrio ziniensis TaxID=2711221 RepID=A0A6G7CKB2_9VIBR|nr:diguanylate cyclase [Vibrio ziniensis]QIH42557.1 diguanylate cyclase [Vibrio ziniensis]
MNRSSNSVLVIDGSRIFRNYLSTHLSALGFKVFVCQDLAETKQTLEVRTDFVFVVSCYHLLDAEDGEVIDLLLENNLKVVVLTAKFEQETRQEFLKKGVLDYILKDSLSSVQYVIPFAKRIKNNQFHHALVVDDSAMMRRTICQLLESQYIRTIQACNGEEALQQLTNNPHISLIISDNYMPEMTGLEMIREIRRHSIHDDISILGLSGSDDKTMTAQYLKAGANDFLHKPFNQEELFCRVNQLLNMQEATKELFKLANQDALTGLWNRRYLFDTIGKNVADRCIAMLDIDFFKKVNDNYGHDGGDAALTHISGMLKAFFGDQIVARFGGEEFCIHYRGEFEKFCKQLERMRRCIEADHVEHQGQVIKYTISIGATSMEGTLGEQIKVADMRLYKAKESGRNQLINS